MRRFHYILSLAFVFVIPTLIAGYFEKDYVSITVLIPFVTFVTFIGSAWDIWATRHGNRDRVWLWQFNSLQTLGFTLLGLPVEEYLFYVSSSLYVIFMWKLIEVLQFNRDGHTIALVAFLCAWSSGAIAIPYVFGSKGDKLIG